MTTLQLRISEFSNVLQSLIRLIHFDPETAAERGKRDIFAVSPEKKNCHKLLRMSIKL